MDREGALAAVPGGEGEGEGESVVGSGDTRSSGESGVGKSGDSDGSVDKGGKGDGGVDKSSDGDGGDGGLGFHERPPGFGRGTGAGPGAGPAAGFSNAAILSRNEPGLGLGGGVWSDIVVQL